MLSTCKATDAIQYGSIDVARPKAPSKLVRKELLMIPARATCDILVCCAQEGARASARFHEV